MSEGIKIICTNRQASHEYFFEGFYEVGIQLVGSEVKSVRLGSVNLKDSFCSIKDNELWLMNAYIKPYEKGSYFNVEGRRSRKLLAHKEEINKITNDYRQKIEKIKVESEKSIKELKNDFKGQSLYKALSFFCCFEVT